VPPPPLEQHIGWETISETRFLGISEKSSGAGLMRKFFKNDLRNSYSHKYGTTTHHQTPTNNYQHQQWTLLN
jgi:hypothetical protein